MPAVRKFKNYQEVQAFLEDLENNTTTRFITQRISNKEHFQVQGDDITSLKGHKILWKDCQETEGPSVDFDGTPYINIGWMVKECHQGPDRQRKAKGKRKQRKKSGDHNYSNQRKARKWIQMSKKQTCPASIRIRVILKFPEFKVDSYDNAWIKRKMSRLLKQAFANREKVKKDMVYLLSYPDAEEHKYHFTGELAGYTQQIDPRLIRKIQELVADGVRNVAEMRRHLCVALKKEICPGENIALTNRRFYPKDKDIKNHMDKALNSLKFSKDDQLNLEALIENWQETNPQDNYFLRSSYGLTDKHPAEEFLFVHQTEWQRRLLSLYGKDVCIMDATYKTSKYALPLFFVCVQTNVGHSICGSFLVSSESKSCIKEGLNKLKQWNPNWSPKYFITDYDEREIQAIEEAFQDCFVYLCAFHREQAWTRWLKQIKNEVGRYQDDIIELMRKVANSPSECSYKEAVVDLRGHPHWQENLKMRTWFEKKWLSVSNRWVKAFRDETVTLITTTNALERKHQEFKKGYLSHFSEGSLCALVTALVTKFLPDSYRSYLNNNIQCLEYCRKYADGVPTFLHNKPRMFVEHCLKRIPPHIQNIPPSNIEELGERKYAVHSVESGKIYSVVITSTQPACTCVDYSIHHLPCKHMLAIFSCVPDCSWNDLPEAYKNNPHFNLDEDILQQSEVNPMSPSPIPEEHLNDSPEDSEHQVASPPASKCTTEEIITSNKENYARPQHIILKESISALKDLQSDLYLVNNTADLEDICQKILELRSYISRKIPKDSGLKLQKGAKSGRLSLKRKPKSLPLNRKYKKPKKNHHVQFVEEDEIIVLDGTFDNPSCEFSQSNNPGEAKHTDFIPDDSCSPEMFDCAKVQEETSHQTLDVETLWKVKPVGYLVAKIATNKIMDNSIQFLKTSLSDEVIDAYLHLLVESKKNKKMFCITSSVATAIFEGRTEHFQGYMSDVKFSDFDIILAAINENYGHWTLLVIYPSEKRLLYINSLGESKRNLTNIGEKWRKYILGRRSVGVSELSHEGWKVETTKHTKQYDSNSCGVYVVKFAELVISDMALSFSCRPDNLSQIRQGIGNQLLQATEPLHEICRVCSLHKDARRNDEWVKCSNCENFFHGYCISYPVNEKFICLMCKSFGKCASDLDYDLRKNPTKKRKRSSFLYSDISGRYGRSEENVKDNVVAVGSQVNELESNVDAEIVHEKEDDIIIVSDIVTNKLDEDEDEENEFNANGIREAVSSQSKIQTDFINSHVNSVVAYLEEIMDCSIQDCEEVDHARHHQFIKNPYLMYKEFTKKFCFGEKFISSAVMQHLQTVLTNEMCFSKPVHGSIFERYSSYEHLQNQHLENILIENMFMGVHYMNLVLIKEAIVYLICKRSGLPYEAADERCTLTERSVQDQITKKYT